ncbi:MAG TPA: hypothetical protein VMU36_05630 [Spirochaetia bacterium]|nr:hypothetical protein [Spirochaetia bacterium]
MAELTVGSIIAGGFSKGFKNVIPFTVNIILWALTVWIPYLNIGTTIGMATIAVKMGGSKTISAVEIFNPVYRKRMGEYFLTAALVYLGVLAGLIFVVIPGLVLAIAWSLSLLLVVGKELNPLEAMNQSNKLTYGRKWTIFGGEAILAIIAYVVIGIFYYLSTATHGAGSVVLYIITVILYLISLSILTGAQATIYERLAA